MVIRKFHGFHEPNPKQEKDWLKRITEFAQEHGAFPVQDGGGIERHHVKGRTSSHKKIHVGRWFVLPISFDFHNVLSRNPLNVTHFKKRYEEAFGKQSAQFIEMCEIIREEDGSLPFPDEVLDSIREL